jgi:HEAT repeat protein
MEARDVVEGTPLNSAVHSGNEGIVRLLIEGGANPNAKDGFGDSPLHFAIRKDPMARRDRIALLKILIEGGANLNSKNKLGFTPLHEAVMQGETAIVRILIEGGADINVGDSSGSTPLDFALHDNNKELVETLRNSGAKTKEPSPEDKIFFTLSLVDRNTRKEKTVVEEFGTVDDKLLPDGVARPIFLENDLYIVRVAVQGFEGEPIRLFLLNEQTNEVMKTFIEEVVPKPSEAGGGTGWMRGGTVEGVQKSMKVMLRLEVGKLSKEKHLVFLPEKTTTDKAIPRFKESNTISSTGDLDSELKTILVHLKNPNKTIRLGAFIELEKLNSEKKRKILPLLIKMIETADEDMKDKLIFAICDFGKDAKEAFVPLLQLLRESINENKTDRQFMIINVMADIGRPEATPVMAELLRSKDHKVSNAVIVTLKKLGPNARPAIPKLIEIAKSPDLCEDVLLILPKIGLLETEAQAASIVDLLESDNCDGFAMFTLIEIGKTLAIPALVEKLSSPKKTTRLYAVRTLGEIGRASGDLRVLPALRSALLQEHDERVIMEIKLYIIKLTLTPVR